MARYTPGPWRFDGLYVDADAAGHMDGICEMLLTGDPDVNEQVRCDGRLIAAAPELLGALIGMLEVLEHRDPWTKTARKNAIANLRTLIEKAGGDPNP